MKKIFIAFLTTLLVLFSTVSTSAYAATKIPLDNGGRVEVHPPHDSSTGQYHGHEYDRKGNKVGSENADGSSHDGSTFTDKTRDELSKNKDWNKVQQKNKGTEGYKKQHNIVEDEDTTDIMLAVLLGVTILSPIPGDEAIVGGLLLIP